MKTKEAYATKFHRDGTVTYWSVYRQVWERNAAERISDETLATLPDSDHRRIARMVAVAE